MEKENILKGRSIAFIISMIIGVIGVIIGAISLGYSISSYNKRYDISAKSAGTIIYNFSPKQKIKDGEVITARGKFYYGMYQNQGPLKTNYEISYRNVRRSGFKYVNHFTSFTNKNETESNNSHYWGRVSKSKKYFFRVQKLNNKNKSSTFVFDWMIK